MEKSSVMKNYRFLALMLIAMVAGCIVGFVAPEFGTLIAPLGTVFINMMFCVVVPVTGLRGWPEEKLFALGRKLCHHPAFPKGANVNFYEVEDGGRIWERTYERGVEDFTHACGTGTGSVVAVLTLQGKSDGREVHVQMTGGELVVDVEARGGAVEKLLLTGPTNVVARGEVTDEELPL